MWIDTDNLIVDCMTKEMDTQSLRTALDSNMFDPRQSAESKQVKVRKHKSRARSKKKTAATATEDTVATDDRSPTATIDPAGELNP